MSVTGTGLENLMKNKITNENQSQSVFKKGDEIKNV